MPAAVCSTCKGKLYFTRHGLYHASMRTTCNRPEIAQEIVEEESELARKIRKANRRKNAF